MKKSLLIFVGCLLMSFTSIAQAPELFNYQGIAHGTLGPLSLQAIGVKISIINNSANGTVVYSESHKDTTNTFGLYALSIGSGTVLSGSMGSIDWASGDKYVKVEIDPTGGSSYTDLGTTQLLSVPFALYAGSSASGDTALGIAGGDLTGSYPNPSIANNSVDSNKLSNNAVTANKLHQMGANNGEVLKWNGSKWTAAVDNTGTAASFSVLEDTDSDTKIEVEKTADEDVIHFSLAGTEYWKMIETRIEAVNTGGSIFIGSEAGLSDDLTYNYNVFIGHRAGYSNTTGIHNIASGYGALQYNTSGSYNVANGYAALLINTTGNNNIANGTSALRYNSTGDNNIANGNSASYKNTTGHDNLANGYFALYNNTTGSSNIANGYKALYSNTTGSYNIANGLNALYTNTTGYDNIATGTSALYGNTTGKSNIANGYYALRYNTSGSDNIANGENTLRSNTTGHDNIANGYNALRNNTTGKYNIATGDSALVSNTTGSQNIASGHQALFSNTTGVYNIAAGAFSLYANTTGYDNIAIGLDALIKNTTGDYNVSMGFKSGYTNQTGSYLTTVGYYANGNAVNYSRSGAFGYNSTITASDQYRIGAASGTSSIGGRVGWTTVSDGRFKTNVKENVVGLAFIQELRPITYKLDDQKIEEFIGIDRNIDGDELPQENTSQSTEVFSGFIAQEVEATAEKLGYTFHGVDQPKNDKDYYGLRYGEFVVPLVKAVQEQQDMIDQQNEKIEKLEKLVQELLNKE